MSTTIYRNYEPGTIIIKLKTELFFEKKNKKKQKKKYDISDEDFGKCLKTLGSFMSLAAVMNLIKYSN